MFTTYHSLSLQSVQGRTPACGNRSFPLPEGGCGGHPYSLAYFPLCFVVVRRSLGHALNVRSLFRAFHASPTEKYTAFTHIRAYTRNRFFAYQPQVARRCKPPPMPFAHCRLPIRRHAVLRYGARSLTYLMYCSLPRALRALPDNEYPALTTVIPASGGIKYVVTRSVTPFEPDSFTPCHPSLLPHAGGVLRSGS